MAAQQRGVREPLFQQPNSTFGQGQGFGGGPSFDVGQQDCAVTGPIDVADGQVVDAVGHDAGIDAEQQQVGDDHAQVRKQSGARVGNAAPLLHRVERALQVCRDAGCADRTQSCQQPGQVVAAPILQCRRHPSRGRGQAIAMRGVGVVNDHAADAGQPIPLGFGIGRQRCAVRRRGIGPTGDQLPHPRVEPRGDRVETRQHAADVVLPLERAGGHPILGQLSPPQIGRTAGEPSTRQVAGQLPDGRHGAVDRARRVDAAVRMDQLGQPGQQVAHQLRTRQTVQVEPGRAPVAEHAGDSERLLDDRGRHQQSVLSRSSSNSEFTSHSASASASASASGSRPSAIPACS
jgi:hypothetical protein